MDCSFEPRNGCKNEAAVNFRYCVPHLNTPRGMQHMIDTARTGAMLVQSDIDNAIAERTRIPDKDAQTTALEKMLEALDRVLAFEEFSGKQMAKIDPSDWRFLDRTGSEQLRSEVQIYERAMERTARVLKDISKMALQEKIIGLGKAQTELMVRILMSTVTEIGLDVHQIDHAKAVLLKKLMEEAHMGYRTREHVTAQLTAPTPIDVEIVDEKS